MTSQLNSPNLLVVYGSESLGVRPYIQEFAQQNPVIRMFNHRKPEPMANCVDINSFADLGNAIKQVQSADQPRIVMIGVASKSQNELFSQMTIESRTTLLQTNLLSYVELISLLLPQMMNSRFGRFVYLSSIRSTRVVRGASLYGASKAFCENLFSAIGREYGRLNITSCSIRMGFFEGRMSSDLSQEFLEHQKSRIALRRLGTAQELGAAIKFAVANPYTNGGIIELDGGLSND